jgi:hypothetical protein
LIDPIAGLDVKTSEKFLSVPKIELLTFRPQVILLKDAVVIYRVITNDMSDYINLLVRIAHSICNHPEPPRNDGGKQRQKCLSFQPRVETVNVPNMKDEG